MSCQFAPYTLHCRFSKQNSKGALIKYKQGFAALHPWSSIGDPSLQDMLLALAEQNYQHPLLQQVQQALNLGNSCYQRGQHVLEQLTVPQSYLSLGDIGQLKHWQNWLTKKQGRYHVKVKITNRHSRQHILASLDWLGKSPVIQSLRLDFNAYFSDQQAISLLREIAPSCQKKIAYIEDICLDDNTSWFRLKKRFSWLKLASDRIDSVDSDTVIIKPAADNINFKVTAAVAQQKKIVITSYFEHPIGQIFASYHAAQIARQHPNLLLPCGLATHHYYQPLDGFEKIDDYIFNRATFVEKGFGFVTSLQQQPWQALTQHNISQAI